MDGWTKVVLKTGPEFLSLCSIILHRTRIMKSVILASAALLSAASAEPVWLAERAEQNVTMQGGGNPFSGAKMYSNSFYAKRVEAAIPKITDSKMVSSAKKAASISSFFWMSVVTQFSIRGCVSDVHIGILWLGCLKSPSS